MSWFGIGEVERTRFNWHRCASEGCSGVPTTRLEAGGVGSNYCMSCRLKIEERDPLDGEIDF